jgi:hypothetical protein
LYKSKPEIREKIKDRRLKKKYGISLKEFTKLSENQFDSCAICQKKEPLCVDHCHETGKIRGLLCTKCNTAIGFFEEDGFSLYKAADYLFVAKYGQQ